MLASALVLRACYLSLGDQGGVSDELLRSLCAPLQESDGLHAEVEARLLARALSLADRRSISGGGGALRLGTVSPLKVLGVVGDLVAHCETLRCAVEAVRRFLFLLQPEGDLRVVDAGGQTTICYEPPPSSPRGQRFAIELALSLIVSVAREFGGKQVSPKALGVPFAAPPYSEAYAVFFECPVTFEAQAASVAFDSALLGERQLFADAELQRRIEGRLQRIAKSAERRTPFRVRVYGVLEREGDALLAERSLHLVAQRLGISSRVLRRRLEAEGTSLFKIIDEFCKAKAMWMLAELGMPLKVVADRLGFSQVSAFHRAFRRWTGLTPHQFRTGRLEVTSAAVAQA